MSTFEDRARRIRHHLPGCVAALLLAMSFLASADESAPRAGPFDREVLPLADGVWLLHRPEPTRQPVEGNITVIAGAQGLLVVDTGGTPLSGRKAIAQIRQLSELPVRWIVNTHWHGDHHLGNHAFRQAWPEVRIIAHENTVRDMAGEAMDYLDGQDELLQQSIQRLRTLLDANSDADGNPLSEAERARYQGLLADVETMLAAYREMVLLPAGETLTDRLVLDLGGREAHLIHPGRGNTEGDVVVHLPEDRILVTGDLVVSPTPYGFGSYPAEWMESLEQLRALDWDVLVPGHGEVQRSPMYLDYLVLMISEVRRQVGESVAAGADLDTARSQLDLASWRERLAGNDQALWRLFEAWWVQPISRSAWLEARGEPIVQGDD